MLKLMENICANVNVPAKDEVSSHADIASGASGLDAAAECPSHRVAEPAGGCGREFGL